ncbi:MAG: glycosyltransferase family 9 protein, partial [Planctomycetota bacterium]
ARAAARARLAAGGVDPDAPFALASVGARPGSAKGYPPDLWSAALTAFAAESRLPLVLAGGPGEEEAVRAVEVAGAAVLRLVDPPADLPALVAFASLARVVLAADSGPRHVVAAAGAPVAVVLGPTDPRHGADHLETTRLVRVEVPCGPCHRETCPLAGAEHHACMRGVAPARLARAALELLAEGGAR